jgi:hypothetical protein
VFKGENLLDMEPKERSFAGLLWVFSHQLRFLVLTILIFLIWLIMHGDGNMVCLHLDLFRYKYAIFCCSNWMIVFIVCFSDILLCCCSSMLICFQNLSLWTWRVIFSIEMWMERWWKKVEWDFTTCGKFWLVLMFLSFFVRNKLECISILKLIAKCSSFLFFLE